MNERQYHRRFHRAPRCFAVLTMVVLSLISIAIDATNGTVVGWSMLGSVGTALVLVLHARLSPRRKHRSLQLFHGGVDRTPSVSLPVPHQATG